MKYLLLFFFASFQLVIAQNEIQDKMSAHVYFLSDDKLEGRATGSHGERLALNYIAGVFEEYQLKPYESESFEQSFDFSLGKKPGVLNGLRINKEERLFEIDYFPLAYSGNGTAEATCVDLGFGIHAVNFYDDFEGKENLAGKVFLINLSSPDGIHPHSKYLQYTDYQTRIKTAQQFGAAAVIFYNEDENLDDPDSDLTMNVKEFDIPVVFIKNFKPNNGDYIQLQVDLKKEDKTGHNIIAYIDNQSENTIVIGAHYDHLGWGESGGSLYTGAAAIHNGADDNASGIALLLELANYVKSSTLKGNNYLFVAFSGEELGLYGSKSFLQNNHIEPSKINYMLNFDMVGRLDAENTMAVNGVGTALSFKTKVNAIKEGELNIKTTESGMGPSDHASFYLANIPVLHFYTGNNPDYHKPSDDAFLINFAGMAKIFDFTTSLITDLDDEGKFEFVKTKDDDNKNAPKFSVTLGVVPDYMYDGEGMRIDGIVEGKPAFAAGVLVGDIVKQLGNIEVLDMMSYMTALSKFAKGDKAKLKVLRNNQEIELNITF